MGSTAQIIGRVAAGIGTFGASEAIRAASKPVGRAIGVDPKIVNVAASLGRSAVNKPVGDASGAGGISTPDFSAIAALDTPAAAPVSTDPAKPGQTDAERERDARLAADRRRKDYQNLGRSSTILTGPGGLAGSGSGTAKTLLGG
jgi:hypothetical protein